jgi:signal transduction histidine kinase
MRGLFFASVSHDLKSPLNAILGLTELVRQEPLGAGQQESLEVIERRGRELLALIETILDAARVEAGQLSLVLDEIDLRELLAQSVAKGKDLGGDQQVEVIEEVAAPVPTLRVDRIRVGRALATFVGHALRTAERAPVRVRAGPTREGGVRIEVEVPSRRFAARQLEAMLDPSLRPSGDHRGLALGLGLARAVVELNRGSVGVEETATGIAFRVMLPAP